VRIHADVLEGDVTDMCEVSHPRAGKGHMQDADEVAQARTFQQSRHGQLCHIGVVLHSKKAAEKCLNEVHVSHVLIENLHRQPKRHVGSHGQQQRCLCQKRGRKSASSEGSIVKTHMTKHAFTQSMPCNTSCV
jgi:hypothetical protein